MAPTPVAIDVRVIAATNRDLEAAVEAGSFRSDLFYRLNVFPIRMPSLRERVEDIPLLVAYLAQRYAGKMGKKISGIDKRTLELFQTYHWPGNVRELQNVIERAVILCEGATLAVDENWLPRASPRPAPSGVALASLADQEKEMIENALTQSRGRVSGPLGAAARLGIPRSTLESRIKSLNINKSPVSVRLAEISIPSVHLRSGVAENSTIPEISPPETLTILNRCQSFANGARFALIPIVVSERVRGPEMLRLERSQDSHLLRVSGRIDAENLAELKMQMQIHPSPIALELAEVTLVDADAVRFLASGRSSRHRTSKLSAVYSRMDSKGAF